MATTSSYKHVHVTSVAKRVTWGESQKEPEEFRRMLDAEEVKEAVHTFPFVCAFNIREHCTHVCYSIGGPNSYMVRASPQCERIGAVHGEAKLGYIFGLWKCVRFSGTAWEWFRVYCTIQKQIVKKERSKERRKQKERMIMPRVVTKSSVVIWPPIALVYWLFVFVLTFLPFPYPRRVPCWTQWSPCVLLRLLPLLRGRIQPPTWPFARGELLFDIIVGIC